MYTLCIEIHSLKQLRRLQPDLVEDVRRRLVAAVEMQGGGFALSSGDLLVFRFERAQPSDHQGVVEALLQSTSILESRSQELSGWLIYLDYLDAPEQEVAGLIRSVLYSVYEDDRVFIGATSEPLLGPYLELEKTPETPNLFRVLGSDEEHGADAGRIRDLALSGGRTETVIEELDPNEIADGVILVHAEDRAARRLSTVEAVRALFGSAKGVDVLECNPDERSPLGPLVNGPSDLDLHETRFWLTSAERHVWDQKLPVLQRARSGAAGCLPDAEEDDLLSVLELLITAYRRRTIDALVPPILLCHDVHSWTDSSVEALSRIAGRLLSDAGTNEAGLIVVATSRSAVIPPSLGTLIRRRIRLPRSGVALLRSVLEPTAAEATGVNWDRLIRVTGGRAIPVHHYLTESRHWDSITDGEIAEISDTELAWRVADAQDTDVKEALLAVHYAHQLLCPERLTDSLVAIGLERVRVPAIIDLLRTLGLIEQNTRIVPIYPDLLPRLETSLGAAATSVYGNLADYLVDLLQERQIDPDENLLQFVTGHESGAHVPWVYHRLVSLLLDCRDLPNAQRLLYDNVPTGGFAAQTRACMQSVLTADRLRLAAMQGNVQAADRVWSAAERAGNPGCDFVAADLALQRARITFQSGPTADTLAHLKRSIMLYQDLNDNAGLARANLDFGLLLLAQENIVSAREYFLLASKAASQGSDRFEQIRAMLLTMVCTYVDGNLSRALEFSAELGREAGVSGMREVELFTELVNGRVEFELGRYDDAANTFASGRSLSRVYAMQAPGRVFERWIARSLIYDDRSRRGIEILADMRPTRESLYFLAEGWLRRGEHKHALEALGKALTTPVEKHCAVESISWSSGFAGLEDRAVGRVSGPNVLDHQIMALRGYLLAESGRAAEGVQEMYRLTRELRISDVDPYNRLYFYLYSLILPESGELNVEDGTTVLGKAVRYIQERTSRMDEYAHKTDFLKRNYWNARLMSHAQNHNLV
jgi:tetratricopeptide (TPR) repeat protein